MNRCLHVAITVFLLAVPFALRADDVAFQSDRDKISYCMGVYSGHGGMNAQGIHLNPSELMQGLKDGSSGIGLKMTDEEIQTTRNTFIQTLRERYAKRNTDGSANPFNSSATSVWPTRSPSATDEAAFDASLAKYSYCEGVVLARRMNQHGVEPNPEVVVEGLEDAISGNSLKMTDAEMREAMNTFNGAVRENMMIAKQKTVATVDAPASLAAMPSQPPTLLEAPAPDVASSARFQTDDSALAIIGIWVVHTADDSTELSAGVRNNGTEAVTAFNAKLLKLGDSDEGVELCEMDFSGDSEYHSSGDSVSNHHVILPKENIFLNVFNSSDGSTKVFYSAFPYIDVTAHAQGNLTKWAKDVGDDRVIEGKFELQVSNITTGSE